MFRFKPRYCSFKYFALHRIFFYKLVNVYICFLIFFQYSDIYYHIYSTIKCSHSFFFNHVLFLFFFLFFLEKSLRMYVDSREVSTSASTAGFSGGCVCVYVYVTCLWRNSTAKPHNEPGSRKENKTKQKKTNIEGNEKSKCPKLVL